MAYTVGPCEQYLCEIISLPRVTEVQPLEGSVDVCKGKYAI